MTTPRRGRRAGDPEVTRRAIATAARQVFASSGYEGATIRAIATEAGVDPALVHHHFGTKESLFVTVHELPFTPELIRTALAGGDGTIGERLARAYFSMVLASGTVESLVRSAMTNDTARIMLREFVERAVLDAFEDMIGGPNARLRLALAGSHLVGVVMLRQIAGLETLVTAEMDEIVSLVGPALDVHIGPRSDPPGTE